MRILPRQPIRPNLTIKLRLACEPLPTLPEIRERRPMGALRLGVEGAHVPVPVEHTRADEVPRAGIAVGDFGDKVRVDKQRELDMDRASLEAPLSEPVRDRGAVLGGERRAARPLHIRGAEQAVSSVQQGVHEQDVDGRGASAFGEARDGADRRLDKREQVHPILHRQRRAGPEWRRPLLLHAERRPALRPNRQVHAPELRKAHEEAYLDG